MNDTDQYAELLRQLAAVGAATARIAARLDRMEQREQQQAAILRDINGDTPPPRRKFRPMDLSSRIGG